MTASGTYAGNKWHRGAGRDRLLNVVRVPLTYK